MVDVGSAWPALPYEEWRDVTRCAHTQVPGKLAAKLAPKEPELLRGAAAERTGLAHLAPARP